MKLDGLLILAIIGLIVAVIGAVMAALSFLAVIFLGAAQ